MAKIVVFHTFHGCETGCCGHVVIVDGASRRLRFDHPDDADQMRTWVEDLVTREGCDPADLDWDHCLVMDGDENIVQGNSEMI